MAKILIFSNTYYPVVGQYAIKEITDRLSEHEYYLITNRSEASWPEKEKIGNINIRRIGHGKKKDKFLFPFRALGYAARLHKHTNFDFVWSRRAFYSGLVALFFKYKTKVPYLLTPEFEDVDRDVHNKIWLWSYFYKRIFREAKITQGITRYLAKRSRNFGNKKEIVLIPDGVDLQIFNMIGCIIQARMGSSRLPGKVMMKVNDESKVIDFVINQIKNSGLINEIIVATSNLVEDNKIVEHLKKK